MLVSDGCPYIFWHMSCVFLSDGGPLQLELPWCLPSSRYQYSSTFVKPPLSKTVMNSTAREARKPSITNIAHNISIWSTSTRIRSISPRRSRYIPTTETTEEGNDMHVAGYAASVQGACVDEAWRRELNQPRQYVPCRRREVRDVAPKSPDYSL